MCEGFRKNLGCSQRRQSLEGQRTEKTNLTNKQYGRPQITDSLWRLPIIRVMFKNMEIKIHINDYFCAKETTNAKIILEWQFFARPGFWHSCKPQKCPTIKMRVETTLPKAVLHVFPYFTLWFLFTKKPKPKPFWHSEVYWIRYLESPAESTFQWMDSEWGQKPRHFLIASSHMNSVKPVLLSSLKVASWAQSNWMRKQYLMKRRIDLQHWRLMQN